MGVQVDSLDEYNIDMIIKNGREISYVVDWLNMFNKRLIIDFPLVFNPMGVDNFVVDKVKINRYDACNVGKGPFYQMWFTMYNDPKPILSSRSSLSGVGEYAVWDSASFRTHKSCLMIPKGDLVMIMREVKLLSIGVE